MLDDDRDPLPYVLSLNLYRRHLTASQKSLIGATLAGLKHGQNKTDREVQNCTSQSIDDAAELLNVSPRSIKTAKKVIESKSQPLIEAVETGLDK